MSQDATVFEVFVAFEEKKNLLAVIVTENGVFGEKALSIITPSDFPRINRYLESYNAKPFWATLFIIFCSKSRKEKKLQKFKIFFSKTIDNWKIRVIIKAQQGRSQKQSKEKERKRNLNKTCILWTEQETKCILCGTIFKQIGYRKESRKGRRNTRNKKRAFEYLIKGNAIHPQTQSFAYGNQKGSQLNGSSLVAWDSIHLFKIWKDHLK